MRKIFTLFLAVVCVPLWPALADACNQVAAVQVQAPAAVSTVQPLAVQPTFAMTAVAPVASTAVVSAAAPCHVGLLARMRANRAVIKTKTKVRGNAAIVSPVATTSLVTTPVVQTVATSPVVQSFSAVQPTMTTHVLNGFGAPIQVESVDQLSTVVPQPLAAAVESTTTVAPSQTIVVPLTVVPQTTVAPQTNIQQRATVQQKYTVRRNCNGQTFLQAVPQCEAAPVPTPAPPKASAPDPAAEQEPAPDPTMEGAKSKGKAPVRTTSIRFDRPVEDEAPATRPVKAMTISFGR